MAFSRITITFNEDLVDGDTVTFNNTVPPNFYAYTWVALRSSTGEVTTATPTANAGEATAINYLTSFTLDWGQDDYLITQSLNVITITHKNETLVFDGGLSNKDVDFVIDSVPSIPVDKTDRINVRSPYFITAPIYTGSQTIVPDNVVFNIYVWSGDKTIDKPSNPSYVINKTSRFLDDNVIYTDVSQLVRDFIKHNYTGTLNYNCVFVSWNILTTYSGGELEENKTVLAFDGYSSYVDNANYVPSFDYLYNNKDINVLLGDVISVPFYLGGDNYNVEFRNGTNIEDDGTVTAINITNTNNAVTYLTTNAENINNIRIENTTLVTEEFVNVDIKEECIYEPIKCSFVNKNGVQQDFWFYKANKIDLTVTNENYKRNVLTESIVNNKAVLSYDTTGHNNIRYNTQGKRNITVNTGYINEDNNIVIEELLLSENIWLTLDGVIKPVDIQEKSLSYLTKRNDQLIKYTLKLGFSYNEIQDIR